MGELVPASDTEFGYQINASTAADRRVRLAAALA
jgi:hypothetical protein